MPSASMSATASVAFSQYLPLTWPAELFEDRIMTPIDPRTWTKQEAEAWLEANPKCKDMVERLHTAGILRKTESLLHAARLGLRYNSPYSWLRDRVVTLWRLIVEDASTKGSSKLKQSRCKSRPGSCQCDNLIDSIVSSASSLARRR